MRGERGIRIGEKERGRERESWRGTSGERATVGRGGGDRERQKVLRFRPCYLIIILRQ